MVWRGIDASPDGLYSGFFMMAFLGFAFVFWPAYTPLAVFNSLPQKTVREVLGGITCLLGLGVAAYFLWQLFSRPIAVAAVDKGLQYRFFYPHWLVAQVAYGIATLSLPFCSPSVFLRLFGLLLLGSHLTAHYLYADAYPSVFCFLAALASACLYLHIAQSRGDAIVYASD
jgi:hypothetical protein